MAENKAFLISEISFPMGTHALTSNAMTQLILPEKQSVTSGASSASPPDSCPSAQFLRTTAEAVMGKVLLKKPTCHVR